MFHPSVRDWVDRWQVWALLQANRGDEALTVAQAAIDRTGPPFTPAKAALCTLLVREVSSPEESGSGLALARPRALKDKLAILGLRGLVRLGRFDLARAAR